MISTTRDAVLPSWHKENCQNPMVHGHPHEDHLVCASCGNYIQKTPEPNLDEQYEAELTMTMYEKGIQVF